MNYKKTGFGNLDKTVEDLMAIDKALLKRIEILEAKMTMQTGINESIINHFKKPLQYNTETKT